MLIAEDRADGVFDPVPEMGQLEKLCHTGHQNADKSQKYQRRPSPDDAVYKTVYIGNRFNHNTFSLSLS